MNPVKFMGYQLIQHGNSTESTRAINLISTQTTFGKKSSTRHLQNC